MPDADDTKRRAKHVPKGDYKVGYCRPPAEYQFKHGNNANPRGRKKGSRNRKVLIEEILLEPVPVREGNTVKTISKLEAVIKQTVNDALKGDHKARLMTIALARDDGLLTPELEEVAENLSETDKSIIDNMQRMFAGHGSPSAAAAPQPSSAPVAHKDTQPPLYKKVPPTPGS